MVKDKMELFTNAKQATKHFCRLYGKKTFFQYKRYNDLIRRFKKQYGAKNCYLASSSGRVELIGNHTDHNGGCVIGCCINLDIAAAFLPNGDNTVRIRSSKYAAIEFAVDDAENVQGGSAGMVKGVVAYLKNNNYAVGGFDAYLHSTVPSGAGISSSAAFETLVGVILSYCYNNGSIPPETLAKAGQYAENEYFNKPSGLLDQSVAAFGGLVKLDFANGVQCKKIDGKQYNVKLALVHTGKSHSNLTKLYASIPQEMRAVANKFGKERLAEVDPSEFERSYQQLERELGKRPVLRAKHFFEENARVDAADNALAEGNADKLIALVNQSGQSSMYQLQNCAVGEQDTAISDVISFIGNLPQNVGARVHGGGFAGTVLCVIPSLQFDAVYNILCERYGRKNVLSLAVRPIGATVL